MAHSASTTPPAGAGEPSVGTLVQSAMADVSTLIRSEIELAKAEVTKSAKKAGVGAGLFGAAGALLAFAGIYFFVAVAEGIAEGLPRWLSYLIVAVALALLAGLAALIGVRTMKKIDKPERTIESLKELPEVMHREAPGQRRRDLPVVTPGGHVAKRDPDSYLV